MKDRIFDTVRRLEGLRDGYYHYDNLEERAEYIEGEFKTEGFTVERDEFIFSGRPYRNIIATSSGLQSKEDRKSVV